MKRRGKSPKQYPSPPDLGGLERALGHDFNNPDLLTQALTHSSATPDRLQSNERLEFLGDRVLGLRLAGLLIESFPDEDEVLAPRHWGRVSAKAYSGATWWSPTTPPDSPTWCFPAAPKNACKASSPWVWSGR